MPDPNNAPAKKSFDLETEVILAVVGLYIFIAAVLLLVHFLQPEGQETHTSSPSPSHAERRAVTGGQPPAQGETTPAEP